MGVYEDAQGNGGDFRIRDLWRWRENFTRDYDKWKREIDLDVNDFKHMAQEFTALKTSVDSMRKTIMGFSFTVAGSAIVFAFSVLVATGKVL